MKSGTTARRLLFYATYDKELSTTMIGRDDKDANGQEIDPYARSKTGRLGF